MLRFHLLCTAALLLAPGNASMRQRRDNEQTERNERRRANVAARQAQEAEQGCCMNVGNCVLGTCNLVVCTPAQACGNCVGGCCSATCGMAQACCGQVASCCGGCWMLVPTCQQCIAGTRQCIDCGCGVVAFVGNGCNDNCIKPCCVEALYKGCLRPFVQGEWVQPCGQCLGSSAQCVGTCTLECARGCRDGAVACGQAVGPACAACGQGCADCTAATGRCVAQAAGDCASGCATCTAACATGCADCTAATCTATRDCLRAFPWGMRCLTPEELRLMCDCLGEAGMACLLGTRDCAAGGARCVRDDVCCYPNWPTLEQIQSGCVDCIAGCGTCLGECASGCGTCTAACLSGCGDCVCGTARCVGECAQGCGRCTAECVAGIPQCTRECAAGCQACCGECAEGCRVCYGQCAEGCQACCGELQQQGAACLAETARQGAECYASTAAGCHRTMCISIPSRFDGARARVGAFANVTLPSMMQSANRGAQRVNTSGAILSQRAGLAVAAPHRRDVRHARRRAEANPEDQAAQQALQDVQEERDDLVELRACRRLARHAWKGTEPVEGIRSRPELLAEFRQNNQLRFQEAYYQYMDEQMRARGWVGEEGSGAPYPLYQTRLERRQQQGRVLAAPTMSSEEFENARALLHTRGAQYQHFLEIADDIMNRRQANAAGWMEAAERPEPTERIVEVAEDEPTCEQSGR